MSKKYIEQPAFEKNEFEVGDSVRVYLSSSKVLEGNVSFVCGRDLVGVSDENFHFKQCRLLKEVKPREFWIREQNVEDLLNGKYVYGEGATISKDSACNLQGDGPYIKFREVLED